MPKTTVAVEGGDYTYLLEIKKTTDKEERGRINDFVAFANGQLEEEEPASE